MKSRLISPRGPMNRHALALSLILVTGACGRDHQGRFAPVSPSTTTSPAPTPTPASPRISTFHLTGVATDDDGSPVTRVTVTLNQNGDFGGTPVSDMTDGAGFYHIDFDTAGAPGTLIAVLIADSPDHDRFVTYISAPASGGQNVSQNLHVYRITRITAGESTVVTVVPGDTLCDENGYYACRIVHIVVPTDGLLTMEVVPTPSAANTGLTLVGDFGSVGLSEVIHVTAGTEVVEWVGTTSTVSQSGVFKTSLGQP
jgi:hypothetical protein